MILFMIIFLIIGLLIYSLDKYFYNTIFHILNTNNNDAESILNAFGFYNKSIFINRFYGILLALGVSLIIFIIYIYMERKRRKQLLERIEDLEELLSRINYGDYSMEIVNDDEFGVLGDEIYKIIVNLKSLEKEAKYQKSNLKKDISNIAHQLKTPITSIGLMAELIDIDRENTDIYLEKLIVQLDRLEDFTHILLKLSQVNSNTIDYKWEEVDLEEIIKEILNDLNRDKEINISYLGEGFTIRGDEIWIYEAFLNIIKNSLDYAKTSVEIEFKSNPIYNEIKIRDDGKGLDQRELDRIFDRFYRGNMSLPGYGIGLNLSKNIIENHKGEIEAYNDNGLVFHIKFYNVT